MIILPAIDIWQGKVVRFKRGNPAFSTIYCEDPLAQAEFWQAQGAKTLHLVDLSAAFNQGDNLKSIEKILKTLTIPIEVGGGIRSIKYAKQLIAWGAARLIIGTKSVDKFFLDEMIAVIGAEKLAVGVDALNGIVSIKGWTQSTDLKAQEFIKQLVKKGIQWIIFTDINRDGALQGPNLTMLNKFKNIKINFIASGGVSNLQDLRNLKQKAPFVWGVIVGKALYDKKFTLSQANEIFDTKEIPNTKEIRDCK